MIRLWAAADFSPQRSEAFFLLEAGERSAGSLVWCGAVRYCAVHIISKEEADEAKGKGSEGMEKESQRERKSSRIEHLS